MSLRWSCHTGQDAIKVKLSHRAKCHYGEVVTLGKMSLRWSCHTGQNVITVKLSHRARLQHMSACADSQTLLKKRSNCRLRQLLKHEPNHSQKLCKNALGMSLAGMAKLWPRSAVIRPGDLVQIITIKRSHLFTYTFCSFIQTTHPSAANTPSSFSIRCEYEFFPTST